MGRDISATHELENLRRSIVAGQQPDNPPTGITSREIAQIIGRLQHLEHLRAGVADLLQANSPVPRQNAQLRILCRDLARLLQSTTR